jgi:hypothetical protein
MVHSAPALGSEKSSLRLRSRRERSDRPYHISLRFAIVLLLIMTMVAVIGVSAGEAQLRLPPAISAP